MLVSCGKDKPDESVEKPDQLAGNVLEYLNPKVFSTISFLQESKTTNDTNTKSNLFILNLQCVKMSSHL